VSVCVRSGVKKNENDVGSWKKRREKNFGFHHQVPIVGVPLIFPASCRRGSGPVVS